MDHDHATGEIRGLLCMLCNQGLGLIREVAHLQVAAEYLANARTGIFVTEKHRKKRKKRKGKSGWAERRNRPPLVST
jgi:hypothetical protein